MTSSTFATGLVQGAARQSWKLDNPRALLKEILDKAADPHNRNKVHAAFVAAMFPDDLFDPDADAIVRRRVENAIEYWFDNQYRYTVKSYPRRGTALAQQKKRKEEKAEAIKTNVAKVQATVETKADLKAKLILMDMAMPNGKPLAECSGLEVRGFGTQIPVWLSKIAERVPPSKIVGKVLSEDDVRKLAPKGWA